MDFLTNLLHQTGLVNAALAYIIVHVCAILLAVIVINLILRFLLARLERGTKKTRFVWDDALISSARRPIFWGVWVIGLTIAAQGALPALVSVSSPEFLKTLYKYVDYIRSVGIIACFAWFLIRLVRNVQMTLIRKKAEASSGPVDRTTIDAACQLLRILIIVMAALTALSTMNVPISGLLAFGGVGTMAVGFAAKDMLANFFGGLMVHLDRPFAVGDWIRSSDKQIEGTVEEVGWRVTRIRTFDARPLYVPNSVFSTITVENPSRMTNRRIQETIGVRYDDIGEMAGIVADIKSMLQKHPDIDQKQTLIVNFLQFNEYSLDIMIYTFTRTTVWVRYHEVKQDVLLKIADIIRQHGAEIAFPTRISYSSPLPQSAPRSRLVSPEPPVPPAPYDDDDDARN